MSAFHRKAILRSQPDAVVCFDPLYLAAVGSLPSTVAAMYYCVDAYEYQPQFLRHAQQLLEIEAAGAASMDVVGATSRQLCSLKTDGWSRSVEYFAGMFEPQMDLDVARNSVRRRPRATRQAIWVGALDHYKIDAASVVELMTHSPTWTLNLVGREVSGERDPSVDRLLALPNVRYHGPLAPTELPALMNQCEVGLISLSESPYSRYSYPLKSWDYLASGLQVLAMNSPSLDGVPGVTPHTSAIRCLDDLPELGVQERLALVDHAYANSAEERWRGIRASLRA